MMKIECPWRTCTTFRQRQNYKCVIIQVTWRSFRCFVSLTECCPSWPDWLQMKYQCQGPSWLRGEHADQGWGRGVSPYWSPHCPCLRSRNDSSCAILIISLSTIVWCWAGVMVVFCEPDMVMLLIIVSPSGAMWLLVSELKLLKTSALESEPPPRSGMEPLWPILYSEGGAMGGAVVETMCLEVRVSTELDGEGQCMKEHFNKSTGASPSSAELSNTQP